MAFLSPLKSTIYLYLNHKFMSVFSAVKNAFKGRSEKRRESRELEKGLDPEQKNYLEMVQKNGPEVQKRLMEFRDELVSLGYQALPVLQVTSMGVTPHIEIQPLDFNTYKRLRDLKVASELNKEEATKEEDKTIGKLDEEVKAESVEKEEVPVYPH